MTSFDDLLSQVPIGQIAGKLGVDEATARDAVNKALPVLLGGLQAKTSNSAQEQSLQGLVDQQDENLLAGGVDVDQVDTRAGAQIVDDVFGSEKNTVINALGATGGSGGNDLVAKVLPILAPIVLAYLGKQMLGKGESSGTGAEEKGSAGNGPLADVLGGLLGGASKNGGLGGALSDALGKNAGSVLGNVLGGLLGGKR
ncbi:DUF937 domain-containing protein [Nocardia sp. NPDC051570]|uniref:DUF937 domain-containing protein n=1 Tax=Nocardia sp. NPDC051570 TaxID=3364324 RepID=UPI0037BC1802